jgi:diguanylate cyclase (GGDEF)-like protein/PAS domain S-box-containing protein
MGLSVLAGMARLLSGIGLVPASLSGFGQPIPWWEDLLLPVITILLPLLYLFHKNTLSKTELERKNAEINLLEQAQLHQIVLNALPAPVFYKDEDGVYLGCNKAFEEFIGLPREKIIGRDVFGIAPRDLASVYREADLKLLRQGGTQSYETSVAYADGSRHEVLFHKAVFHKVNGRVGGMVGAMVDISERKEAEKTIKYLANFDPLTNLPNQVLFTDRLNLEIVHSQRLSQNFAVMNLDLDHFMKINNTFGHHRGDELLQKVARRLVGSVREGDTISKMGGDSFILLLPNIAQEEHAAKIAGKILEMFAQPFELGDQELFITASIGIAMYPYDGTQAPILLQNAGTALSRAKTKGRNNFQFYAPAMNSRSEELLSLESDLRRALEREELALHFQAQVDAETSCLIGAEALVRWKHPKKGILYPNQFIHLAEETGLIVPIGEWVLREVCCQARSWIEAGLPPLRLAANLSPRQFQEPHLFEMINRLVRETGIDPSCLSLEITENVIMADVDHTIETLFRLKNLGLHLAIDDFGTGHSSLSYLRRFPIDLVKIDRSFISDIPESPDDMAIVSAVIAMAHNLNIRVLAEGVQSEKQKEFLRSHCCDELQGYLVALPLPANDFRRLTESATFFQWGPGRLARRPGVRSFG